MSNRKERRAVEQIVMRYNKFMTRPEAKAYVTAMMQATGIPDGAEVKIAVDKIINDEEFNSKLPDYKEFVLENRDRVFHAVRHKGSLFAFAEDDRWLFYESDLEVQDGKG